MTSGQSPGNKHQMAVGWFREGTTASSRLSCKPATSPNLMDDRVVNTGNKRSTCRALGPPVAVVSRVRVGDTVAMGPWGLQILLRSSPVFLGQPFTLLFLLLPRVELCTPTCFLSLDCKWQTATLVTCKPKACNTPLLVHVCKQLLVPAVGTAPSHLRATLAAGRPHSQL